MRSEFLLDPEVVLLNHRSFGACPRPIFERYQAWQRELERQPVGSWPAASKIYEYNDDADVDALVNALRAAAAA